MKKSVFIFKIAEEDHDPGLLDNSWSTGSLVCQQLLHLNKQTKHQLNNNKITNQIKQTNVKNISKVIIHSFFSYFGK